MMARIPARGVVIITFGLFDHHTQGVFAGGGNPRYRHVGSFAGNPDADDRARHFVVRHRLREGGAERGPLGRGE